MEDLLRPPRQSASGMGVGLEAKCLQIQTNVLSLGNILALSHSHQELNSQHKRARNGNVYFQKFSIVELLSTLHSLKKKKKKSLGCFHQHPGERLMPIVHSSWAGRESWQRRVAAAKSLHRHYCLHLDFTGSDWLPGHIWATRSPQLPSISPSLCSASPSPHGGAASPLSW